jgi:glycosyltransferase involved in cell wall biosynthesis
MKILLLQDDFPPRSRGGAGMVSYRLAKVLQKQGHEISIITSVQRRAETGTEMQCDIRVYKIYSKYHPRWRAYLSLYNPMTVSAVRKIITDRQPDVVHAHNIHTHLSYHCVKIAKQSGAKVGGVY